MVNKQYTIQHQPSSGKQSIGGVKRFSPPPIRNSSIISDTPNPSNSHTFLAEGAAERFSDSDNISNRTNENLDIQSPKEHIQTSYGRNITLYNGAEINDNPTRDSVHDTDKRFSVKELSINDIGRFQYILQMDREMGANTDTLHRVPYRPQKPPSLHSFNSGAHINFWKAGSESPTSSSDSGSRQENYRHLRNFWTYAKWPIAIIFVCIMLASVVVYIMSGQKHQLDDTYILYENFTNFEEPNGLIGEPHEINNNRLDDYEKDEVLSIYLGNPKLNATGSSKSGASVIVTTSESETNDNIGEKFNVDYSDDGILYHPPITTSTPHRNTQILQITNQDKVKFDYDGMEEVSAEEFDVDKRNPTPTKESLQVIGFTSGHQNNFGVPIEEDARILKMLNDELLKQEQNETNHYPTTDSSLFKARVSPTLPVIFHRESTTEESSEVFNTTDVGQCESTSLDICRGILHYDLTTTRVNRKLTTTELEHFKYLFDSNCSTRAAEFVCSYLEPECRPTVMGILQPCKRICKSILEPCASIIASSEVLTRTFDCDRYPDSSDRNVCEDPTRRGKCNENEFQCLDSSCIPNQWKCDNIKDCSLGEDEENCLFCEHEEYRCHSNDKCIPDKWRCDQYEDCPDGSDESDCYDYEDEAEGAGDDFGPRIYSFASIQSPDSPNSQPYLTISEEERLTSEEKEADQVSERDHYMHSATEHFEHVGEKQSNEAEQDDKDEIQTGEASGRIVTGLPKNIANFQDSKEIMMTSDSENDFKYSTINRTQVLTTTDRSEETILQDIHCPENQLRCVSGKCITVTQICDKTIDCPDGADEAMCVYKDEE